MIALKPALCRLLVVLLSGGTFAAAEPALKPGLAIVPGVNDATWHPLFQSLAHKGAVLSEFTERRWFPFRREPIVLQGEMRSVPNVGLSLHYTQPEQRIVIIDGQGLLVRDAAGRTRAIPNDPRATAATSALLPILRFDEAELTGRFQLRAAGNPTNWRFDFVPLDPALARLLGDVSVSGQGEVVRTIEFRRSAKQHIEIEIGKTSTGVNFTADELRRFFR